MIAPGILLVFFGYGVGSWGWCLVKGYDITLRQWFSPIHPWIWPAGDVPAVPPGQIFPGATAASAGPTPQQRQTIEGIGPAALNLPPAVIISGVGDSALNPPAFQ